MTEQMIEAAMKAMREEQRVNQNLELGFDDDVYDLAVLTIAAIEPFIEGALKDRIEALTAENERLQDIADAKIDALTAEVEELREHLSGALETLRDAGVCDDKCSLCNEAFAALDTGITIEAPQEGGWKEAGQPWLWTYDAHLKEKQP